MANKPWHKRWHGNALNGMRELTLELRGAYTTLLDLMYDAGGPVRLDERRLCGELDCDVRVFRRVMTSLLAAEKIRLWSDGAKVWVVNDKVLEVVGSADFHPATCAELTADLRDKFGIANAELSPTSTEKRKENNGPKNSYGEKTPHRGRGERKEPPIVPQGDGAGLFELLPAEPSADPVQQAFDLWNEVATRHGLPKAEDLTDARRRSIGKRLERGGLDRWRIAMAAVEASAFCVGQIPARDGKKPFRAHLDFVCQASSYQKLVEGTYGQDAKRAPVPTAAAPEDPTALWRRRMGWLADGSVPWRDEWGPRPGKPDCTVPAEILREFGIGADVLPFEGRAA
ncbi:hypothetical protein [Paraburkholderia fungorum]|uniref:hypothetical protein n=1 Tax=Paraburkholderia fungorum TaxID=134537 RepID=UPI003D6A2762